LSQKIRKDAEERRNQFFEEEAKREKTLAALYDL